MNSNIYFNENISAKTRTSVVKILRTVETQIAQFFTLNTSLYDFYIRMAPDVKTISPQMNSVAEAYESGVIFIDLKSENFNENELAVLAFHELNHIKFFAKNPQSFRLFNYMTTEGIAKVFENEVVEKFNYQIPDYMQAAPLSRAKLLSGLRDIIEITEKDENWDKDLWFYNFADKKDSPQNFGYKIGEFLVEEFRKKDNVPMKKLVELSYEDFWKFAKDLLRNEDEECEN